MLKRAFETQLRCEGFTFVEVLTMCPTGWFIPTAEGPEYMSETLGEVHLMGELKVDGRVREAGGGPPVQEVQGVDAGLQRQGDRVEALDANVPARQALVREQEDRRRAATAKCYDNVKKALGAKTAMRFLQVEYQLLLLIDLQIASALPIAK